MKDLILMAIDYDASPAGQGFCGDRQQRGKRAIHSQLETAVSAVVLGIPAGDGRLQKGDLGGTFDVSGE